MSDYEEAINKLSEALLLLSEATMKQGFAGRWLDLVVTFKVEDETVIVGDWLVAPMEIAVDCFPTRSKMKH